MELPDEYLELILRHFDGGLDESDKTSLIDWLEENPARKADYASLKALYEASKVLGAGNEAKSRMLFRLNARIDSDAVGQTGLRRNSKRVKGIRTAWTVAAAVAVLFLIGFGILRREETEYFRASGFTAYSNKSNDVKAILLDDSTKVWLGTMSSIRYGYNKKRSERIAELKGDAYFDVHRDESHPFIVKTESVYVEVLGTAFCVSDDDASGKVSVVLERGSVCLQSPHGVRLVRLSPDQRAEFDAKTGDLSVEAIGAVPYVVQRYNRIALQQATLQDIITHIERMYGVRLSQPYIAAKTKRYDLNYIRTDTVDELLETVQVLTGTRLGIIRQDDK